jgi:hypothetical protein
MLWKVPTAAHPAAGARREGGESAAGAPEGAAAKPETGAPTAERTAGDEAAAEAATTTAAAGAVGGGGMEAEREAVGDKAEDGPTAPKAPMLDDPRTLEQLSAIHNGCCVVTLR